MGTPLVRSGKFYSGTNLQCGENVVIDVAEEVIVGDRCVLPDNAYFSGRRITIGNDFYGYSWGHSAFHNHKLFGVPTPFGRWLEIGRGRREDEDAILDVGSRCVFHDNRIDLARRVDIGSDVGLSPEVVIYTHGYWMSPLHGFPMDYGNVFIGNRNIIGFRSLLLPGSSVGNNVVVGAQSVVAGHLRSDAVYAGSPARKIRDVKAVDYEKGLPKWERENRERLLNSYLQEYTRSVDYRMRSQHHADLFTVNYPIVTFLDTKFDVETLTVEGEEDERTDDFRWFMFTRGIRFYTLRPFRKLPRRV